MLKRKLEEKDRIIADKEEQLATKNALIEAKVKVISEQEEAVKTLSSQLEGNANLIAQLQTEQKTESSTPEVSGLPCISWYFSWKSFFAFFYYFNIWFIKEKKNHAEIICIKNLFKLQQMN